MKLSNAACGYLLTGALHQAKNVEEATEKVLDVIQIIYFSMDAGEKIWVDVPKHLKAEQLTSELQRAKIPYVDVVFPGLQKNGQKILFSKLSIK